MNNSNPSRPNRDKNKFLNSSINSQAPIRNLLDKLPDAKPAGKDKWIARCPAHDDKRPSLSIGVGNDGRALLKCFAGCSFESICGVLGIEKRELMPESKQSNKGFAKPANKKFDQSSNKSKIVAEYNYCDESGKVLFQAVRMLPKDFLQRQPAGNGKWNWSVKGVRTVPYRLPDLLAEPLDPVFIVEGEKDVDNLFNFQLLATCNAGGAGKWKPDHSSFLKGRYVIILPDNDDPGRTHALLVAKSLAGIAKCIKIVELPGLPLKGDVSDWIEAMSKSNDADAIRDELFRLVESTPEWNPGSIDQVNSVDGTVTENLEARSATTPRYQVGDRVSPNDRGNVGTVDELLSNGIYKIRFEGENGNAIVEFKECDLNPWPPDSKPEKPNGGKLIVPPYKSFPVHALPSAIREFVENVGAWADADPVFAALPALTLAGASIGLAACASPKKGYNEPPLLWACCVADSGTGKTPCLRPVTEIALKIDKQLKENYLDSLSKHEAALHEWKENEKGPESKPFKPKREYFYLIDTTIERLAETMGSSPRGVIVISDELAGWLGSFTRYSKGKMDGSDLPNWLSIFEAGPIRYHRKTGEPRDVESDRSFAAVCGGVQPKILRDALNNTAFIESGFMARLIFAMPPKKCPGYSEADLNAQAVDKYASVISYFRELPIDQKTGPTPVRLTSEALARFTALSREIALSAENIDGGPMSATLPKIPRLSLRLALIWHCVDEVVHNRNPLNSFISDTAMANGEILARWFVGEAERVFAMWAEKPEDRAVRNLVDLVKRKGGRISIRDLMRSNKSKYKTAAEAEEALKALIDAHLGKWDETPRNEVGRPHSSVFILFTQMVDDSRQNPTIDDSVLQQNENLEKQISNVLSASVSSQPDKSITVSDALSEQHEERAAIIEYDGLQARKVAEQLAQQNPEELQT